MLVFHTSGVTERQLEIEPVLEKTGIDYEKKLDYISHVSTNKFPRHDINIIEYLRKRIKSLLQKSHIVAKCDFRTDARFWTVQIRGHYAYRRISTKTLQLIYEGLVLDSNTSINDNCSSNIVIHYRLGDLLSLTEKSEIEFERIYVTLKEELERNRRFKDLLVLTDSPDACKMKFEPIASELEDLGISITITSESTFNTISHGIHAKTFIGTNSKISFWIVYFRSLISSSVNNTTSYIPVENTQAVKNVIGIDDLSHIIFYY